MKSLSDLQNGSMRKEIDGTAQSVDHFAYANHAFSQLKSGRETPGAKYEKEAEGRTPVAAKWLSSS